MNGTFAAGFRRHVAATIALELLLVGFLIAGFGYVMQIRALVQSESEVAQEVRRVLAARPAPALDAKAIATAILSNVYHPDLAVLVSANGKFYKGHWMPNTPHYVVDPASQLDVPFSIRTLEFVPRVATSLAATAGYRGHSQRFGAATVVVEANIHFLVQLLERLAVMLAVAIFLAVLLANIAAQRLTKRALEPLHLVLRELESFASGDLTPRRVATTRGDEFGRLAAAYNGAIETVSNALAERRRAENQMRQFTADAAHQLRTPLTVLRGFIGILRKDTVRCPEDLPRILDTMDRQSAAMSTLIKKLMLLQDWDCASCSLESVNVGDLVEEIVAPLAGANPQRQIRVGIQTQARAKVARDEFTYALTNLVDNALKYAPQGEISVLVDRDDAGVKISVADCGAGISNEQVDRIFDRFYRGEQRDIPGSGLGLAIAKRAVERAHGTLCVDSTQSRGSCFTITLPALHETEERREPVGQHGGKTGENHHAGERAKEDKPGSVFVLD